MTHYGYARVSTTDQDLTIQVQTLRTAGCSLARQQEMVTAIRCGSASTWAHFNLSVGFDFSEERMVDSTGLTPPRNQTLGPG